MVRVAGLKNQQRAGLSKQSVDGLTPAEQLEEIATLTQHLNLEQQDAWQTLREELFAANVVIHEADDLSADQVKYLQKLFREEIVPVLTPIAVDRRIRSRSSPISASRSPSSSAGRTALRR